MSINYWQSDEYRQLAEQVIAEHPDLSWIDKALISIDYLECDAEKKRASGPVLGECVLVKDLFRLYVPFDFLIVIYAPNVRRLSETQKKILLYHELLHVDMGEKDGEPKYCVRPHDVEDFAAVIRRYGLDWAGDTAWQKANTNTG